jgi:hypothetical protein
VGVEAVDLIYIKKVWILGPKLGVVYSLVFKAKSL